MWTSLPPPGPKRIFAFADPAATYSRELPHLCSNVTFVGLHLMILFNLPILMRPPLSLLYSSPSCLSAGDTLLNFATYLVSCIRPSHPTTMDPELHKGHDLCLPSFLGHPQNSTWYPLQGPVPPSHRMNECVCVWGVEPLPWLPCSLHPLGCFLPPAAAAHLTRLPHTRAGQQAGVRGPLLQVLCRGRAGKRESRARVSAEGESWGPGPWPVQDGGTVDRPGLEAWIPAGEAEVAARGPGQGARARGEDGRP